MSSSRLFNAKWGGSYPPPRSRRLYACTRCASLLSTDEERLTDLCGDCWDRPLRWTASQMDRFLWDVLEGGRKPPTLGERLWERLWGWWWGR